MISALAETGVNIIVIRSNRKACRAPINEKAGHWAKQELQRKNAGEG